MKPRPRRWSRLHTWHRIDVIAWILLALVLVMTVGPIKVRPVTPFGPNVERFAAYAVLGIVFGLAHPRRLGAVAIAIVVFCGLSEFAQHFVPGRHADFDNFLFKSSGAVAAILLVAGARGIFGLWRSRRRTPVPKSNS